MPTFRPLQPSSHGVSSQSKLVTRAIATAATRQESSVALFGQCHGALGELAEICEDCAKPDWDGYGAHPVANEAAVNAESFLYALPRSCPAPEISPEPDGSVALIWYGGRRQVFSVSFEADTRVTYAGLDGTSKWRGVEIFDGNEVPEFLLAGINRVAVAR
ncbi:MAG: hypothetical protein ACC661_04520 [Verrucomicrobiales bacterium]